MDIKERDKERVDVVPIQTRSTRAHTLDTHARTHAHARTHTRKHTHTPTVLADRSDPITHVLSSSPPPHMRVKAPYYVKALDLRYRGHEDRKRGRERAREGEGSEKEKAKGT